MTILKGMQLLLNGKKKKAGRVHNCKNIVIVLWQFIHIHTLKSLRLSDLKTRICGKILNQTYYSMYYSNVD